MAKINQLSIRKSASYCPNSSLTEDSAPAIRREVKLEADRLRWLQVERGYRRGWVYFELKKLFSLTEDEIYWLADFLGYQRGWAWHQTAEHRAARRELLRRGGEA